MASSRVGASVYSLINPEDLDAVAVSHMKSKLSRKKNSKINVYKTIDICSVKRYRYNK